MSKNFTQKVFLLIAINIVVKPLWIFGVERWVQVTAGFDSYGLYFTLFNFTFLISIISDLGLSIYNSKLTAQSSEQKIIVSNTISVKLFLTGICFITALIIAYILGYKEDAFWLFFTLLLYQLAYSFLGYFRSYLKGLQNFKSDILISVLDKGLIILLCFLFSATQLFKVNFTIQLFANVQLIFVLLNVLLCIFLLRNKVAFKISTFNYVEFKAVLKEIVPFSVFMFLVLAYNKVDSIMLERMLLNGALESGNYAAAYRLLDAICMMPILFASFFYPLLSKHLANGKRINELIEESSQLLISIAIIIAVVLYFNAEPIMQLLYGNKSSTYLVHIYQLLIWNIIPISIYYIFSSALTAKGNLKALNMIALFSLLLNIVLNFSFIPLKQAEGAAIATFISLTIAALAYLFAYQQIFKAKINLILLLKFVGLIGLMFLFGRIFSNLSFNWMLKFVAFTFSGFILCFVFKIISLKKIITLFKFTA